MNISRGQRKLKAYDTGYFTIRESSEGYIIIAHFQDWKKSHAIDFHNVKPDAIGKAYPTFRAALQVVKKSSPNLIQRRALKAPLAKSDYYYDLLIDHEEVMYKN